MFILKNSQRVSPDAGFTLVEILIALFIFTLLSMMMLGGLRMVINTQSSVDVHAERVRQLQMAFLMMSRDITQAVNRPVLNTRGKEDLAFVGSSHDFVLTHMGLANPSGMLARSNLGRTRYYWGDNKLWRMTWPVLDQAPTTTPHARQLVANVESAQFQYMDKDGRFSDNWPIENRGSQPLPKAVRVTLTITQAGEISQLYVLARGVNHDTPATSKS